MRTLRLLTCLGLLPAAPALCADPEPYAIPFEVGQRVEITLAKPYRSAEGIRVQATSTRLADKDLLTLAAGGQERALPQLAGRGRVQGLLTAVDDAGLTLDLGEEQSLLRIPREAVVRWETLGLAAQGAEPLPTGRRVRVASTELGGRPLTGNLLAVDDETLLVKVTGRAEPLRLRRSSLERFEVSRGTHNGAGKGALIGGVILGIAGAIAGAALSSFPIIDCEGSQCGKSHPGPEQGLGLGFLVGAMCGAPIGALVGNSFTIERWERTSLSVAVAPQRRGGRAALSLRF